MKTLNYIFSLRLLCKYFIIRIMKILFKCSSVATLILGSWPRQGLAKVQAKSEAWKSHFMLLGVWESVREWTSTLPDEFPLWELDSRWILESSKTNCKGQNQLDWNVPYIIGKLLKIKWLKWAHMTHLGK